MCRSRLKLFELTVCVGLLLFNFKTSALVFEPGVGVGLEYTNNVALTPVDQLDELIVVGYVGARLEEINGPVQADITASLNHQRYTKDTFEDRRYFNLGATAGWEMIKNRFNWLLSNYYLQRPINYAEPNTPDNIQDINTFIFGADIVLPISARQTFTLLPEYKNFYYETLLTDNQQYSLAAGWNYQMNPLTTVGLNASVRTIDYDQPLIEDVTFSSIFIAIASIRARSDFSTNLGATHVERDNGQSTEEFTGNLSWLLNLTNRSKIRAYVATGLTDSHSGALNATIEPDEGDPNNIQITADVIRNQVMTFGYHRLDGTLDSSLTGELHELNYSETPNDRKIRILNAVFNYPVTPLVISGFYARYNKTDYLDADRIDNSYTVGGNIRYQFSRKLHSLFDLKYRNRDSTLASQNFDEWSVFVTLTYGFGQPLRPTHVGVGGF